jgi:hypothetical protein
MVFPDAKNVQTRLIGEFDALDQMAEAVGRADFAVGAANLEARGKTVHADLHRRRLPGGGGFSKLGLARFVHGN